MTISTSVKMFVLRALLAAGGNPMRDETLKDAIRSAHPGTAFTNGDLTQWIRECESSGWISGTTDELHGVMWDLTPKGRIKAQQL